MSKAVMDDEATVGEFLIGILPRFRRDKSLPSWPPDCFGLCLALLKRTGAYAQLLQHWPPGPANSRALKRWTTWASKLGGEWRKSWQSTESFDGVDQEWQVVRESFEVPLREAQDRHALCEALMKLVVLADEACEGVGAPQKQTVHEYDRLLDTASAFLTTWGTLCYRVSRSRLRVFPKMHTPQTGLTDRSLSHYLCLCDSSEVTPHWLTNSFLPSDSMNLLLIPWPFEVLANEFQAATDASATLPENFGFFAFTHDPENRPGDVTKCVEALYAEAKRKLGRIDGVVLPELSITDGQFAAIRKMLPPECFIVAGVGRSNSNGQRATNEVKLSFPTLEDVVQKKHHPWKLDESQVIQYGLGGGLSPYREWWEYIDCTDRHLNFISISEDLVLCALICEDLARPDPVANIVRAVGPNLVVALLMDGPQTKERWAARYATVLADDPGCSVLSLTSLGMSQLSSPEMGKPSRSRVVALWKDRFKGAIEIELPLGKQAVAISLSTRYHQEFTADGRGDGGNAAFPILSGVHPIGAAAASEPR